MSVTNTQNIDLKKLFLIAKDHIIDILNNGDYKPDLRLEEAKFNEEEGVWDIIISYLLKNENITEKTEVSPLNIAFGQRKFERIYKKVKIDTQGKFIGLFMYTK